MNQQSPEKKRHSGFYDIHSIFKTIQGEGPFTGCPAIFVRLAGCNLQCPSCDTDYTSSRTLYTEAQLLDEIRQLCPLTNNERSRLVVITGGEPFRQANLPRLFDELVAHGFFVQIETNGTLAAPDYNYTLIPDIKYGVYIVCSPKTGSVHPSIEKNACCYKYVLTSTDISDDGLPVSVLGHPIKTRVARPPLNYSRQVYVQPADMKDEKLNRDNLQIAIESCLLYGYTLQLQMHKLIGVP